MLSKFNKHITPLFRPQYQARKATEAFNYNTLEEFSNT